MQTIDVMLVDGTQVAVTAVDPPQEFLWHVEHGGVCDIVTSTRPTHSIHCPARQGGYCCCDEVG